MADLETIEKHVMGQLSHAQARHELKTLKPCLAVNEAIVPYLSNEDVDWLERTRISIDTLLPRLPPLAERLLVEVPRKLNSGARVVKLIEEGEALFLRSDVNDEGLKRWFEDLRLAGADAKSLISNLESQQISAEIQRQISSTEGLGDLVYPNGNSIYPDLIIRERDYSMLPLQSRKKDKVIAGPSVKGKARRPSNVPDGCEIKTNRGSKIRVDAHGAHCGLHLGVTWELEEACVSITGVWVAYVKKADHRESARTTKVTTVKYSFGHDLFISLL